MVFGVGMIKPGAVRRKQNGSLIMQQTPHFAAIGVQIANMFQHLHGQHDIEVAVRCVYFALRIDFQISTAVNISAGIGTTSCLNLRAVGHVSTAKVYDFGALGDVTAKLR